MVRTMPKIAIIEDDLAIAQMYRLKFEAEGYQADIAENGKLGLILCEQMKPDIVLLDLMMPEMNGIEFCRKARRGKGTADIAPLGTVNARYTVITIKRPCQCRIQC